MMSKFFKSFIALAVLCSAPFLAWGSEYPSKPIQLIIGFPPGGPTDIIGRVFAEQLSKQLGQQVVVMNRGGAGGTLAAAHVASQKPDGYTLMIDVESVTTRAPAIYRRLQYDPIKDFSPVAKFAKQRVILVAHPSLAANNVQELIAFGKANPDKLTYSGTYSASSHIGGALFGLLNSVSMTMISYPGGSQPITDLIGGVVSIGFFTEATVVQHIKAGKLKALAIAANERSSQLPQVPTLQQAGAVPMDVSPWFGVTAPAGTPAAVIEKLHRVVQKIVIDPAFTERLTTIGAVIISGSTPEDYRKENAADVAYWKKFVVDAKLPMAD